MPFSQFDRRLVRMQPLSERANRVIIEKDAVCPDAEPTALTDKQAAVLQETAGRIRAAMDSGRPVVMAFGAHTIKNGLAPVLASLVDLGAVSHLATNGAGVIHDWEFAWLGQSSEHVAENVAKGAFGNWDETGTYINLAINVGAYRGLGYGESVGAFISDEGLQLPSVSALEDEVRNLAGSDPGQAAAAADLLSVIYSFGLPEGHMKVPHRWKAFSIQAHAFEKSVPFTSHPMFGHDIIYNHPMNHGSLLGRAAQRDFLSFADSISRLDGGVYLSVGSAVMSPMIFEKSLSMAQNVAQQDGDAIMDHFITVVDLSPESWDWSAGEPPEDHPAYYQRFNKSFSRMGGTLRYLGMDNRDFLLHLHRLLQA